MTTVDQRAASRSAAGEPLPTARLGLSPSMMRAIMAGVMLAMFLSSLDQTIVASALPTIGRDLGAVENLPWVVSAYLVSATAITPLYGKLADIHGRRAALLGGLGVFVLGSVASALAETMTALIFARALQGLGGGSLIALSQTIIADIMGPRERALWQAYFGAAIAAASLSGAVLGGVFSQYLHWSLVFWINVPLGLAGLAIIYRGLAALPQNHRPHQLDVIGALLMASATVTMLLALTWGGTHYAWTSPTIAALAATSLAFWLLFVLRLATAAEPFLPLSILGIGVVRNALLTAFFAMGTSIGLSVYVPIYLQTVMGLSAAASGLGLIPLFGCGIVGATIAGRAIAFARSYKRLPLISLVIGAAALTTLAMLPAKLPLAAVVVLLGMAGFAGGSMFPVTTVALQNAVPPHRMGTATAAINFSRQLGGAILVAAFGAILLAAAGVSGGHRAASAIIQVSQTPAPGIAAAFGWIFGAAATGLALAFVFLFIMEEQPLHDLPAVDRAKE